MIEQNRALSNRESQIEQQPSQEVQVIQQDAEKVGGSSAGLFALGGLALLTLDPVQAALKDVFDGVSSIGKFVSGIASSINGAFEFLLGGSSSATAEASQEQPQAPREGGVGTTPAGEPVQGTPPIPTPATADATPAAQESPSFMNSVTSGAIAGGAIGMLGGRRGAAVGAAVGATVGAYNYATGGSSSPSSSAAPASTGGSSSESVSSPTGQERVNAQPTGPMGDFAANFKDPVPGGSWSGPGLGLSRDGGRRRHQGIDIFAPMGTPVYASADGEVVYSERRPSGGFGMAVQLKHTDGYITKYAHLSGLSGYGKGDRVRAGDVIGYVGDTGNAKGTPPHLHYEVWRNGAMQEPANYLSGASQTGYAQDGGMGPVGEAVGRVATASIETVAKLFGALGSAIIKPGIPKTDIGATISQAAKETNAEIATARTPEAPTPPPAPAPPRINRTPGGTTENPPTMADRNGVYYYLHRFGYHKLSRPESSLMGSAVTA
jgi:murein DD-endopeptidase MepM/ murein hydrolase activator NlpD